MVNTLFNANSKQNLVFYRIFLISSSKYIWMKVERQPQHYVPQQPSEYNMDKSVKNDIRADMNQKWHYSNVLYVTGAELFSIEPFLSANSATVRRNTSTTTKQKLRHRRKLPPLRTTSMILPDAWSKTSE